jgi:hypothetical protein
VSGEKIRTVHLGRTRGRDRRDLVNSGVRRIKAQVLGVQSREARGREVRVARRLGPSIWEDPDHIEDRWGSVWGIKVTWQEIIISLTAESQRDREMRDHNLNKDRWIKRTRGKIRAP